MGTPSTFSQNLTALDTPKHYRMEFTWPPELSDTRNATRTLQLNRSFDPPGFGPKKSTTDLTVKINHEWFVEEVSEPGIYTFTLRDTEAPGSPWDGKEFSFTVPEDCVVAPKSTIEQRLSCGRLYLPEGEVHLGQRADQIDAFQIFASHHGSHLVKQVPEQFETGSHHALQVSSHSAKGKLIIEGRLPANGKMPEVKLGFSETFQTVINAPDSFSLQYRFPKAMEGQPGTATALLGNDIQVFPAFRKVPDLRGVYRILKPVGEEWLNGSDWALIVNTNYITGLKSVGTKIVGTSFHQPLWDLESVEVSGDRVHIKRALLIRQTERDRPEGGEELIDLRHKVDFELERVTLETPNLPPAIQVQLQFKQLLDEHQARLRKKKVDILHTILQEEGLAKLGDLARFFQLAEQMPAPSVADYYRLDRRVVVDMRAIEQDPTGEILQIHPGPNFDPDKAMQKFKDIERSILRPRQF